MGWKKIDQAIAALAYDAQAGKRRVITLECMQQVSQRLGGLELQRAMEELWSMARSGQVALFEAIGANLQIFHLTMQEFIAARHVWKLLDPHALKA